MYRFLCLNKHLNTLCWFVGIDEDDQNGTFLYSRESLEEGDLDDDIIADEQDPFLGTDIFLITLIWIMTGEVKLFVY